MSIWTECEGPQFIKPLFLEPWRMVEAQHISSSRDLVESREEHDLLEELIENSKPTSNSYKHYLIFTPFRYPPLQYGSRFGTRLEPSLWYGSQELHSVLAEVAFYRLKFFTDTEANLESIEIPMTAFKAYIETAKGIDLTHFPFKTYEEKIAHKSSYEHSQSLGTELRKAGVEAFIFSSARDKKLGKNIAAFTPEVFIMKNKHYITNMQNWRCYSYKNAIEFTRSDMLGTKTLVFTRQDFELLDVDLVH